MHIYPSLQTSLSSVTDLVEDLQGAIDEAGQGSYFDSPEGIGGEAGIFGKIAWPVANDTAIMLVEAAARSARTEFVAPSSLSGLRERWRGLIVQNDSKARSLALWDLENRVVEWARRLIDTDNPYDFEHELAGLDVCRLFSMGADLIWPDLRLNEKFSEMFEPKRTIIIELLNQIVPRGTWPFPDEFAWNPADLTEWTYDWLPDSFWWRHLPDYLNEEAA